MATKKKAPKPGDEVTTTKTGVLTFERTGAPGSAQYAPQTVRVYGGRRYRLVADGAQTHGLHETSSTMTLSAWQTYQAWCEGAPGEGAPGEGAGTEDTE